MQPAPFANQPIAFSVLITNQSPLNSISVDSINAINIHPLAAVTDAADAADATAAAAAAAAAAAVVVVVVVQIIKLNLVQFIRRGQSADCGRRRGSYQRC